MMRSENEFEDRVALITGATSGIGRATAIEFAAAGANVVATGRRIEQGEVLEAEANNLPGEIKFAQADVMIADDVKRIVDTAVDSFGGLDFAFNNAGASRVMISEETGNPARLHEYTDEHWDYYSDMFLKSMWRCMKHEIEVMLPASKGVIINNASIAGLLGGPNPAYATMKHGVTGLTKSAARQYAGTELRFNAVCPGWIDTEMTASWKADAEKSEFMLSRQSVKRPGASHEVASLVKWLCSDGAAFVDGAIWPIDGGFTA
jgi:NAD(P)-dependent dehydrogenase (short-subunit alcohol dehydrogenase family)